MIRFLPQHLRSRQTLLLVILFAFSSGFVFFRFIFPTLYRIPSRSMLPNLAPGDVIAVTRSIAGTRAGVKNIQRGDVIVFHREEEARSVDFVKRVIGLPGDKIESVDGKLLINGAPVADAEIGVAKQDSIDHCAIKLDELSLPESSNWPRFAAFGQFRFYREILPTGDSHFLIVRKNNHPKDADFSITVPNQRFFVLGDNRDESADSRKFGFVKQSQVVGRVSRVLFSLVPREEACAAWASEHGLLHWPIRSERFYKTVQ